MNWLLLTLDVFAFFLGFWLVVGLRLRKIAGEPRYLSRLGVRFGHEDTGWGSET